MAKKNIVTHDGKFHADDVFAVAALLLLEPAAEVLRSREARAIGEAEYVADVGGVYDEPNNRFDHHQIGGAGERKNGVPYASFGLVWKKFGEALSGNLAVAGRVDEALITPIDANDNGVNIITPKFANVYPYGISDAVRAFVPTWEETPDLDARFKIAVELAKNLLLREISRARSKVRGEEKVISAYKAAKDRRLVVLDNDYSWKDILARFPEPLFAILPQEERWNLYSVRDDPKSFKNRRDLPGSWAGLRGADFAKVTGVPDAIFCHRNRFVASARSQEGALTLAALALTP